MKRALLHTLIIAALIAADQLVKHWARAVLAPAGSRVLIPGLVGLRYTENTGAAFSMLENAQSLLIVLVIAAIAFILWFGRSFFMGPRLLQAAILCVVAGAVGNLIDRLWHGYVTDMFEFLFVRFAIFNVADIALTAGVVLFVLHTLFRGDKRAAHRDL